MLSDALASAPARRSLTLCIDIATLTGALRGSLMGHLDFGDHDQHPGAVSILESGGSELSSEKFWELPLPRKTISRM